MKNKKMNDVEKAFYDPEKEKYLKKLRENANKYLLVLQKIVMAENDPKFTAFIQTVVDSYMMNECELGRSD